jgi:hypothetical protein
MAGSSATETTVALSKLVEPSAALITDERECREFIYDRLGFQIYVDH